MIRWLLCTLLIITSPLFAQEITPAESRTVTISWEEVLNANYYEILFTNENNKEFNYKTSSAEWSGELEYGKYNLKIRSYDSRDVPGKWSTNETVFIKYKSVKLELPTNKKKINSKNEDLQKVKLKWSTAGPSAIYKLKVKSKYSKADKELEIKSTETELELPVADIYTWTVQPYYNDIAGQLSEESSFAITGPKLSKPIFKTPESQFTDTIEWKQSKFTKLNYVKIEHKRKSGWKTVSVKKISDNKISLDKFNGGNFRLSLMSKSPLRKSSDVVKLEHYLNPKRRDPAFVKKEILKDSISKPTDYYFIASYLVTQINYANFILEDNNASSFDALGGTGRLGFGWKDKDSPWGVFGILDLSGFNLGQDNYSFPSIELHTTYMIKPLEVDQLNFSAGIYNRQLPLLNSNTDGSYSVDSISQFGIHTGMDYWYPLTSDIGVKVHSQIYYGLPSGEVPNRGTLEAELSYQYGLLGSYRLSKNWMGFVGYTYRLDKIKYKANENNTANTSLTSSTVEYGGHYLNLQLEVNF